MPVPEEFEREVFDGSAQLQCRIWGYGPVQAEGTVAGKLMYFRARWDAWTFALATSKLANPIDIYFPEQGFVREGDYGRARGYEASWMSYDDAEAIIRRCAQEYVASTKSQRSL